MHTRITVAAAADEVLRRINPTVGVVEAIDEHSSVLVTGADSVETVAAYIGMLGIDFTVTEPRELVDALRIVSERYARAIGSDLATLFAGPPDGQWQTDRDHVDESLRDP